MSFLPEKAACNPLSIKGPSLMLHMLRDHAVIVTLAMKCFSAWLFEARKVLVGLQGDLKVLKSNTVALPPAALLC